jgi:enamine deaminase RidA (YjgF/YER057c/UK114 family)
MTSFSKNRYLFSTFLNIINTTVPRHLCRIMSAQQPQTFNPPNICPPKPTYSHVSCTPLSSTSTLITIAGQLGLSVSGQIPSSLADQVALALENLSKCLEAAGATTRDIVKVTQYIVDYDPSERSRAELYLKFIGDHRPPSTLVGVTKLAAPELLYEIEAMAVVHEAAK